MHVNGKLYKMCKRFLLGPIFWKGSTGSSSLRSSTGNTTCSYGSERGHRMGKRDKSLTFSLLLGVNLIHTLSASSDHIQTILGVIHSTKAKALA